MPQEPAWLTSVARDGGLEGRNERPAMGRGQSRPASRARFKCEAYKSG